MPIRSNLEGEASGASCCCVGSPTSVSPQRDNGRGNSLFAGNPRAAFQLALDQSLRQLLISLLKAGCRGRGLLSLHLFVVSQLRIVHYRVAFGLQVRIVYILLVQEFFLLKIGEAVVLGSILELMV